MLGPFATRAAARPFSRCRYRYSLARRLGPRRQQQRRQRQRVTEGTAMAPWNGPKDKKETKYTNTVQIATMIKTLVYTAVTNIHLQ